jgi:hypothetical protein
VLPRYGACAASCASAFALTQLLWSTLQPTASPVFFVAVVFNAWFGGIGPGLLSGLFATCAINYYFLPDSYPTTLALDDLLRLISFSVVAASVHGLNLLRKRSNGALERENKHVDLLIEVNTGLNEAATVDDAFRICLDRICAHTGWPIGHIYVSDEDSRGQLEGTVRWHLDDPERFSAFVQATSDLSFVYNSDVARRVFHHGRPIWINDVTKNRLFLRARQAKDAGVKTGLAFPILVGTEVIGVLEFFSARVEEPNERLTAVMALIGIQLGRAIRLESNKHLTCLES